MKKLRILSIFHGYPPHDNSGAEHTLHATHKWLISQGHKITVWCAKHKDYTLDKVNVIGGNTAPNKSDYDLIFTHLNHSGIAVNLARQWKMPVVHFTHSDIRHSVVSVRKKGVYVVHNSKWVIPNCDLDQHPYVIVNPPTFAEDYILKGKKNQEYITLCNLNKNKGGFILVDIALAMPDYKFLAVKGAYGDQVKKFPKNVKVIDTQTDIKKVLRQTKVLIMPSQYESWGKLGVEAMVSGIPVVAHPTEGLKESLGDAGIFIHRKDTKAWAQTLTTLMNDEKAYEERSKMCKLRVKELDPIPQLERMQEFLLEILNDKWKHNL